MKRPISGTRQSTTSPAFASQRKARSWLVRGGLGLALGTALWAAFFTHRPAEVPESAESLRRRIAEAMVPELERGSAIPASIRLRSTEKDATADGAALFSDFTVQTTLDEELQSRMEALLGQYRPDYAAFVAIEPESGRILSLVSHANDPAIKGHLALRATFPSASVFKVVTAAAAIGEGKLSPGSVIPFNGRNHTLYRSNVLDSRHHRWTRFMTLREAFGKSVNTVFGRIGAFSVGPEHLKDYAERFGFNVSIPSDLPVQEGRAQIGLDAWTLAETASGFTQDSTMSPLQGAMIAAAIANDGSQMVPYLVDSLTDSNGRIVYAGSPELHRRVIDPRTAGELRELMQHTVTAGTSRKSFRGFFRGAYADAEVGGKTGSLTGTDPRGKYDWFVGYAELDGRRLAVAALTVNIDQWRVKSSWLARRSFEIFLDPRRLDARGRELAQAIGRDQGRSMR